MKLWSSQLWTQFWQLHREAWNIQDFTGIWPRDLVIPVRRSNQLSYRANDVGSWWFVRSNRVMNANEWNDIHEFYEMNHILNCRYEIKWSYDPRSYECNFNNIWFTSYVISVIGSFITGKLEPTNDLLPISVASYLSWLECHTGIGRSRVQTLLKSWIFQASLHDC